jgi:hypothetical protein
MPLIVRSTCCHQKGDVMKKVAIAILAMTLLTGFGQASPAIDVAKQIGPYGETYTMTALDYDHHLGWGRSCPND